MAWPCCLRCPGLALRHRLPKYNNAENDKKLSDLAAYSLALVVTLVVVVAYFTASVVGESPYESLSRLHMRYYNFLFPLFLMVVAGQITTTNLRRNRYVVFLSTTGLIALILFSFRLLLRHYTPSLIDCPELHGVTMTTVSLYLVGILGIVSLLAWAFSQRRGAQLALFLVMPVAILLGAVNANTELRQVPRGCQR